jgi:hypothetical protein
MQLLNITKIEEGLYSVESLPCPQCGDKLVLQLAGRQVYAYHNTCLVDEVLPDSSPEDRERFITGICPPCWDKMFNPEIEIIGLELL